jgi:hypothetical protein
MKKKLKCFVCHKEVNEEDDYVFKGQTVHKGECLKSMIDEYNAVRNLQIRNKRLCAEIERLNNIINTMLDFNFFKEECPLNFGYTEKCDEEKAQDVFYENDYCEENCNDDYKKCWLKYFERLQELKGSDSNVKD